MSDCRAQAKGDAGGAVLAAAIGSTVIGLVLVIHRAGQMLAW